MRTLTIAAFAVMLGATTAPADAQRLGSQGGTTTGPMRPLPAPKVGGPGTYRPQPGGTTMPRPARWNGNHQGGQHGGGQRWGGQNNGGQHWGGQNNNGQRWAGQHRGGSRWGAQVGGRWYGGSHAPGGWNSYRRPVRGWTLPRYWIAPTFFISDWSSYGLSSPPRGYNWTRYYDDAVLTDGRGQVWDSVSGLDWDRYDDRDGYDDGYAYGPDGQDGEYPYGGAGGSAGGGYVQQDYQSAPPPPYGAPYGTPRYDEPPVAYAPSREVVQQRGYSSGYSTSGYSGNYASSGYVSGGYWYPPATTTTVTVQSAPVIETTTTYIDEVTYSPRKVYRAKKKVWRAKPRQCGCR